MEKSDKPRNVRSADELLNDVQKKIESLSEKKRQLEERQIKLKIRSDREEHARDTRRKILMGAALLAEAKNEDNGDDFIKEMMDRYLTRIDDRALFGLPPLPPND